MGNKDLRQVIFVTQVMSDIRKQADTSIYQNENLHSSSITIMTTRNHQLTFLSVKAVSKARISEKTNLCII